MSPGMRLDGRARAGARRARWAVLALLLAVPPGCGEEDGKSDAGDIRATLAERYFKENCAMGFEVHDGVYTEWADALKRVVEFRGEIVNDPDLTASSGALVLRITEGNDAYPVGRYTVVRWSDFTGATVAKRVAAKGDAPATRETAAAALAELTVADGWFDEFCCPFAVHYTLPRLAGAWTSAGSGAFTLERVATAAGAVFQFTQRQGDTLVLQGTVDRTSDLTASGGYLRVLVTDGGTAGLTPGQYTVVAWRSLADGSVEEAVARTGDAYAAVADKAQAHLTFTVAGGNFGFQRFTR